MNKILSICVPSYNMEAYLQRNIDSMLKAKVNDELEIIIVNDGSKDNTLKIANDYKTKYPQTIEVIDKHNGHYGSCVNAALQIAKGKYFRIVDADDWVDSDALRIVIQTLAGVDADMIYTPYCTYYEETGNIKLEEDVAQMPWGRTVGLNNIKFEKYLHMHQIAYRLDLLKRISYHQTEGICYTDTEFNFIPCIHAETIHPIQVPLYQYYIGRENQSMSTEVINRNFIHLYKVLESITNYPKPTNANSNYDFLRTCYIDALLGYIIDAVFTMRAEESEWNNHLRVMMDKLKLQNYDLTKYMNRKLWGCPWVKLLYKNDVISRFQLKVLFLILKIRLAVMPR